MNIQRNKNASLYNVWFKKEYPELFECDIKEFAESCDECGFCDTNEVEIKERTMKNET